MSSAHRRRAQKERRGRKQQDSVGTSAVAPSTHRGFLLPMAMTVVLVVLSLLPRVQGNPILARSFWGAAIVLLVWQIALFLRIRGGSAVR